VAVFERFTDAARQAVMNAQEESRELGHPFIGAEHLLLGVARTDPSLLGVDERRLRATVVETVGSSMKLVEGYIPFTDGAKSAIEHALGVALARGDRHIGPTQLLLALLEQPAVRDILRASGGDPDAIVSRLAPADPPPQHDAASHAARADARLLLDIALRDGEVAAWLREHGVDEAAIRARFGAMDL
jgi:ATP-dependent Clp protease ATP-binding subunit ClpA